MARRKSIAICGYNFTDFSDELLNELCKEFIVYCISDKEYNTTAPIKFTQKKPPVFVTLRKNSICFNGDAKELREELNGFSYSSIAFDVDGVINSYISGYNKDEIVDPVVVGIPELIKNETMANKHCIIYSTRCNTPETKIVLKRYLDTNGIFVDDMTTIINADVLLVDDRVIDYTKVDDVIAAIKNFIPWTIKNQTAN